MRVRVDYIIRIPFYGRYAVPGIRPIESATEFGFWNSEIGIVNYENDLITLAFHTMKNCSRRIKVHMPYSDRNLLPTGDKHSH